MFETYNVPSLFIANKGILSLLSLGKLTGMVVHSGNDLTYTVTVFDGFAL